MRHILLLSLLLLVAGALLIRRPSDLSSSNKKAPLVVYCAAGLKKPVESLAAEYTKETGVEVQIQYGGTATLLSSIRTVRSGDVFIAADTLGIEDGRKYQLLSEVIPIIRQRPVLAVPKGNPKNLRTLEDLKQNNIRFALTNPESAAIGRVTRLVLGEAYEPLSKCAAVTKPTVTDIATDLQLGTIDAAIVWDSTVAQFAQLESVFLPVLSEKDEEASAAILASTKQSPEALRFSRYLAAPERGGNVFSSMGFPPIKGDKWISTQEMILYSGGVNRPAVEQLLREFSDREGAKVTTIFNGCGVLCASMKTMGDSANPKFPDAYYACDLCFIPPLAKQFPQAWVLTETEIGIVVKKGNPKNIRSLQDLSKQGLRVGLCNAEQSTLGFMTRGMLKSLNLTEALTPNVAVQVPTADFLINQMRAGALDAAVVYRVNAAQQSEHLDFLPIPHPGAKASQPFSIRPDSPNAQLAGRLLEFFKAHRDRFESAGFLWKGEEAPVNSAKIEIPAWLRPNQVNQP